MSLWATNVPGPWRQENAYAGAASARSSMQLQTANSASAGQDDPWVSLAQITDAVSIVHFPTLGAAYPVLKIFLYTACSADPLVGVATSCIFTRADTQFGESEGLYA